jgi:catechol 2,3-dioxygenase-like lactoylglutathione lyase family enzyme
MPIKGLITLGPIFGLTAQQADFAIELAYHGWAGAWMTRDHPVQPLMKALWQDRTRLSEAQIFCVLHSVLAKACDDWEAPILTDRSIDYARAAFASLKFDAYLGPLQVIDHVQIAIPKGGEVAALSFYRDLLGLTEVPKPSVLALRGGAWYQAGQIKVHLGVEDPFRANDKAHVAFLVDDVAALAVRAADMGFRVKHDYELSDQDRAFIYDPFGNRIEVLRAKQVI